MTPFPRALCFASMITISASTVAAEPIAWRLVLSSTSNTVLLPHVPAGGHSLSPLPGELSDAPAATLAFNLTRADGRKGLWREFAGNLQPYAEVGIGGAVGPGRGGSESTHVFRLLGSFDSNAEDQRVFGARAGDPSLPLDNASYGMWRVGNSGNVEIARIGTDGALGPGLGPDWFFATDFDFVDSVNFAHMHALPGGGVLLDTSVSPPPGQMFTKRQALVRYSPGIGNVPCAVVRVTDPALAPGVLTNDYFDGFGTAGTSRSGEIFATASSATSTPTIATRRGIWKFCNGAPQVRALSAHTGSLGPNIPGNAAAVFDTFMPIIAPTTAGAFYFSGEGSSPAFKGIFHHANGQNTPVLLNEAQGALGPGIAGFAFDQVIDFHPLSAGRFGLVYTRIQAVGGSAERFGLWRLRPDAAPEPVLLEDDNGPLGGPVPERRWETVSAFNVFENGVVAVLATTSTPPSATTRLSLWRMRPGHAPEEILKAGDSVRVPTANGLELRAVRGVSNTFVGSGSDGLQNRAGDDSWISASGNALVEVVLEGIEGNIYPTRYVRAQVTNLDVLLEDSFE